jgi:hypothetical protein
MLENYQRYNGISVILLSATAGFVGFTHPGKEKID